MHGKNIESKKILSRIPSNSVGCEIGVWKGLSSELFLSKCSHLHLVDSWQYEPYLESEEFGDEKSFVKRYKPLVKSNDLDDFKKYYNQVYQSVVTKFQNKPVTIHRQTSDQFFEKTILKVDWIYLDASHEYKQVKKDLHNCLKILKPEGVFLGDDYQNKPGVKKAVDEFVSEKKFILDNFYGSQFQIKF